MLPGKKFTPEDVVRILVGRIWWVLLPIAVVGAGAAVVARVLPDQYSSEALIQVVPQKVPEGYVRSTVTTKIEDRLAAIKQLILSRTRLEQVIEQFDLYAEERRVGILEDVVQKMIRNDVRVPIIGNDSFKVIYVGRDPRVVKNVTEKIAQMFIDESLLDRQVLAEGTSQFLAAQVQDAERELVARERRLEDYKRTYSGELPTQVPQNMQQIQNLENQIQNAQRSMDSDRQSLLQLGEQVNSLQSQAALAGTLPAATAPMVGSAPALTGTTAQMLAAATVYLESPAIRRLKPGHPDLESAQRSVRSLQAKLDEETGVASSLATTASITSGVSATEADRLRRLAAANDQITQIKSQLARNEALVTKLRADSEEYRRRVSMAPTRETEMTQLTRDYDTYKNMYTGLMANSLQSKISADLEVRQIGEQFKLVDPARVPQRPFSPDRAQIGLGGVVAGLVIGLALVAFLEYRNSGFKTDEEIRGLLDLPVLAVVPFMQSASEKRRVRMRRLVTNVGLGGAVAVCFAVVVYTVMFVR